MSGQTACPHFKMPDIHTGIKDLTAALNIKDMVL